MRLIGISIPGQETINISTYAGNARAIILRFLHDSIQPAYLFKYNNCVFDHLSTPRLLLICLILLIITILAFLPIVAAKKLRERDYLPALMPYAQSCQPFSPKGKLLLQQELPYQNCFYLQSYIIIADYAIGRGAGAIFLTIIRLHGRAGRLNPG